MSVRFDIDFDGLEREPDVLAFLARFGEQALREAQRLTAERVSSTSGQYARSFRVELKQGSPPKLWFGNVAPYAIYVEEDTVAHDVVPKPKGRRSFTNPNRPGALRWFDPPGGGKGAAVFAQKVHIPAHKGAHIVRDAVSAAGDSLST